MAEASTKTVLGKISQGHLECPICCCRFSDPKMLDCLHSFCLNCLDELMSRQQPKADKITCPVCRRETSVPDTGLQGLTNCFFLSSIVDEFNKQEKLLGDKSAPTATCEQCDEGLQAIARCQDCDENICQKCNEYHRRRKQTKKHRIVTVESLSETGYKVAPKDIKRSESQTPKCRKHPSQEVCFYCYTCEVQMCGKCAAIDHRSAEHKYSEIAGAIGSFRKDVDEILQKFQKSKEESKITKNSIEHARNRLSIMVDRACRDITDKAEEEIAKITEKCRHIREMVTEIGRKRDGEFEEKLRSNCAKMDQAEKVVAAVNDLMQQADDFELMDFKPKVMQNLEFQEELRFAPAQHSRSFIGVKCHDIVRDSDLGEILYEEKWQLKEEFGEEGEGDGEFMCASDVACFSSGDIVLTDMKTKRLTVLTPNGVYKNSYAQAEGERLLGAAVTCDDQLLVIDTEEVKVFDSNLQLVRQFTPSLDEAEGDSESVHYYTSVAVDKKNRIAVADKGRKVISLHSLDGSLISTIPNKMVLDYLAISNKERLVFPNYVSKRLLCVDFMGKEVFNIAPSIDGVDVFLRGVCCDYAGYVYVCTCRDQTDSGEIHHYDPEGMHIERVAHGLHNPWDLTFSPDGDLVVADMHSVKIFHRV